MNDKELQEVDALMKRCQRGFPRHMIDESNNLHADCYGMLGKLKNELVAAQKEPDDHLSVEDREVVKRFVRDGAFLSSDRAVFFLLKMNAEFQKELGNTKEA